MVKRAPAKRRPRKAKPGTRGLTPSESILERLDGPAADAAAVVEKVGGHLVPIKITALSFYEAAGAHKAHAAGDRIIYNKTTGALYFDPDGTGNLRFEAFFFNSNGTANTNSPNGGVETLYTVSGLAGAGGCSLAQPSFAAASQANNLIFRIPTPVFGAGLLENIDDSTLIAVHNAQAGNNLGISGTFNHNGNDGTIARFGWKAQNKSLDLFSGEAYNVEMGISNETFPQDRPLPGEDILGNGLPANCLNLKTVGYPEDVTNFAATSTSADQFAVNASVPSDVIAFAQFMRLLAPPTPSTDTPGGAASITRGKALFSSTGCSVCHTPTINSTQPSHVTPSLGGTAVNAFSDLQIHHMGTGLTDNVSQGNAGGDQFRTAPLWGVGQRIFFLHDGRTSNLVTAITAHASTGSEATTVEQNFVLLSAASKQDLLNFLRSL